jgi:hypothetical protein
LTVAVARAAAAVPEPIEICFYADDDAAELGLTTNLSTAQEGRVVPATPAKS